MNKFLLVFAFFLFSVPYCISATIEAVYEDEEGKGFNDETPYLVDSPQTLGEARKNAFEHAASLLGSRLATDNTIRVGASFFSPAEATEEYPCPENSSDPLARARPKGLVYFSSRFEEGNPSGFGVGYTMPLAEAISGQELNGQETDMSVKFNNCKSFYYGISEGPGTKDFVSVALHEIIHGLGFISYINDDGSSHVTTVEIAEEGSGSFFLWEDGYTLGDTISLRGVSIYDAQMYSERDSELLINLSASKRREAFASYKGLSWVGTDGGRNSCSYGQRMVELQTNAHGKTQDGKPLLAAVRRSETTFRASRVHLEHAQDVMTRNVSGKREMDLSLGMLKDIGWEIDYVGFPPSCVPTGITVSQTSDIEITEGGSAEFRVELDSEPMGEVSIPLRSSDSSEVVITPDTLRFTTMDWNITKTVTLTSPVDSEIEPDTAYEVTFGEITSDDRFYQGFDPDEIVSASVIGDIDVSFEESAYSVAESDGSIDLKVELSPAQNEKLVFYYSIRALSANEADYVDQSGQVSFFPGETESTITIDLVNNNLEESDETFEVVLRSQADIGMIDSAEVTITDLDDQGKPLIASLEVLGCTENQLSICSSGDTIDPTQSLDVKVKLNEPPGRNITMRLVRTDISYSLTSRIFHPWFSIMNYDFPFTATEHTISYVPLLPAGLSLPEGYNIDSYQLSFDLGDNRFGISLPEGVTLGNASELVLTVDEIDPITVSFEFSDYELEEGEIVDIKVILDRAPGTGIFFPIVFTPKDGTSDLDYSHSLRGYQYI